VFLKCFVKLANGIAAVIYKLIKKELEFKQRPLAGTIASLFGMKVMMDDFLGWQKAQTLQGSACILNQQVHL